MRNRSLGEKAFEVGNTIFLIFLCMIMIYPMLYVFGRSGMTDIERAARPFGLIPYNWDWSGYEFIFKSGSFIFNAYGVTILRTVAGTAMNMIFTIVFAYVLSKKYYPPRVPLTMMVIFTMWFNGGLIPNFILVKSLGLYNQFASMILPGLISVWNLLILRNFLMQLPDSLEESAKIDGAHDLRILIQIIVPVSMPAITTISLFYAVSHWNAWFDALIYITDRNLWPVQVFLRELVREVSLTSVLDASSTVVNLPPSESVIFATIVIATVPILCVYPFIQKYFVKGVMMGSLKG